MKYLITILIVLILGGSTALSQYQQIVGEASLHNITRINNDTIEFEIVLKRTSDKWLYFANSTFHITFDTTQFTFDSSNLILQRDSTDLKIGILAGDNNPIRGYTFQETINQNHILISILGPETVDESDTLKYDTDFILGKYKLITPDERQIPLDLRWQQPTLYFQAAAAKIEKDSLYDLVNVYYPNDNIELHTEEGFQLLFTENYLPFLDSCFLVDFIVEYAGQKKMTMGWETAFESNVVGYTIKRAFRPSYLTDPSTLDYKVIYTWRDDETKKFHPEMFSKGNSKYGFFYGFLPDSVEFRGREYCYQLYCTFYDSLKAIVDTNIFLAQKCVPVPNTLVVSAQIISQNPFKDEIELEFKLADDCLMTIKVFDLNGKEIGSIEDKRTKETIDMVEMQKGIHTAVFEPMPMVASAGYYIYFIATPIDDNSIENSNVVIKVMNLK